MRTAQLQRINFIWFISLGVTALAAGILVYLLLIESALGAFSIRDASPALLGVDHRPTIYLLESESSRRAYGKLYPKGVGEARYDSTFVSWQRLLAAHSPAQSIDSLDTSALRIDDVLILPSSLALSEDALSSIRAFVDEGGSLLISWAAGLYDNSLTWRGWSFIDSTFGVRFERFIEPGPSDYRHITQTNIARPLVGVYIPKYHFQAIADTHFADLSSAEADVMRDTQRAAEAIGFSPLGGYVWFDTLKAIPYGIDYASVEIQTDSMGVPTDSVIVSFHTWIGGDVNSETPYPRTASSTRRFTFRGGTPLTAGIPGGYRAKVRVYNPGVSLRITDPDRANSGGFWYDFVQDEPVEQNVRKPSTGLVYGTYGRGRFVFMGFSPDVLDASLRDAEDLQNMDRLYENVIRYLRREPIVWTQDWPNGHTAAVMVSPILSKKVGMNEEDVESLISILTVENVPGTFFVEPDIAVSNPALVVRLADQGEVGLFDTAPIRTDMALSAQRSRIRQLQESLSEIINAPITGYRSNKRGALRRGTMQALSQNGFTYFLPDSIGRRTTPKIMGSPYESLSRIGRTTRDAYASVLADDKLSSHEKVEKLLAAAYRVLAEGGVYILSPTPGLFASEHQRQVFKTFLKRLKQENFWFATGSEIAHWWRLRKGLNTDVEQRSASRIFVRLSNDNGDTAEQATVSIALERRVNSVIIRPELINILKPVPDEIDVPPYELKQNSAVLELSIRELKPQQYRIFHVDLISEELKNRFTGH